MSLSIDSEFAYKVLAIGPSAIQKNSFLKKYLHDFLDYSDSLGVSIGKYRMLDENYNKFNLYFWSFSSSDRFNHFGVTYCQSAKGVLLFFDAKNKKSFYELNEWVDFIRNHAGNVPIILIIFEDDSEHKNPGIQREEIQEFVDDFNLTGCYFISNNFNEDSAKNIFENLLNEINLINFRKLSIEEKETYRNFIDSFSKCVICGKENHSNYLRDFLFSHEPEKVDIRKNLSKLLKHSTKRFGKLKIRQSDVVFGIPCCDCFKKYFEKN